ncbi:MAG: hypothetical protein ACOC5A_04450, partial [Halanaerobiales bacterium]
NEERDIGLLNNIILHILLDENGYILKTDELINKVKQREEKIVEESENEEALKHSDPETLRIYERVLKEAWKWQDCISSHEQNILDVLKEELDLSVYEHRILESKLGYFPQKGNKIHGIQKIRDALKNLQYRGLLARIKDDEKYFVIPGEIAEIMRDILGIELSNDSYLLLLGDLKKTQLQKALQDNSLPKYGTKDEIKERLISTQIKPSTVLSSLTNKELKEFLHSLENVNISGSKKKKITNIISYYNNLVTYSVEGEDPREKYYNYIIELANRDYEQLRGNNVINKDLEIEHNFEKATGYLFEILMGLKPTNMEGNDNPDGRLRFNKKEVILWDNKSCEGDYTFPEPHFNQFKRYIIGEKKRVTLFLIIAPAFDDSCINKAQKLKAKSKRDTDVGLITAEELKYVAENWRDYSSKDSKFNLEVLNYTGRLTKKVLDQRMEWAIR